MKHVLCGILLGVLGLHPGPTLAQERAPGTRYTEERSGLHGTAVPGVRGGALGYQVKEGLAVEAEGLGYGSQADRERTGRGPGAAEALPEAMGEVCAAWPRVDLAPHQNASSLALDWAPADCRGRRRHRTGAAPRGAEPAKGRSRGFWGCRKRPACGPAGGYQAPRMGLFPTTAETTWAPMSGCRSAFLGGFLRLSAGGAGRAPVSIAQRAECAELGKSEAHDAGTQATMTPRKNGMSLQWAFLSNTGPVLRPKLARAAGLGRPCLLW